MSSILNFVIVLIEKTDYGLPWSSVEEVLCKIFIMVCEHVCILKYLHVCTEVIVVRHRWLDLYTASNMYQSQNSLLPLKLVTLSSSLSDMEHVKRATVN